MPRDTPLSEIILRKYERPYNIDQRQLVKKICLSLGLLQPGDSRDVVVDILMVLIEEKKNKTKLNSDEIKARVEELRKANNLELKGVAESNIRRQLKRLRDIMIVDKQNNQYFISEFETLNNIFEQKIEKLLVQQSVERIKEYLKELEK
ncbi:MAG: hypothetical protein WC781_04075 [Candidatus Pacearchaeota archaeon]|jgi:hypothetical protein